MYVPNLFTCLERRFHQNSFTHQVYSNIDQAVRTSTWNRELEFFASVATASWGNFFLNVVILTTCNSTHLLNKFHIYCVNPCTGRNVGTQCFFPRTVKFKCFQLVLSCFKAFTHFCRKLANDAGFASKSAVFELVTNYNSGETQISEHLSRCLAPPQI